MQQSQKQLAAFLLLALLIILPASGALKGGTDSASIGRARLFRAPVVDTPILEQPVITTPPADVATPEVAAPEAERPAAVLRLPLNLDAPAREEQAVSAEATPEASIERPVFYVATPEVTAPVQADVTMVSEEVNNGKATPEQKPGLQKIANSVVDRAIEDGLTKVDPRKQAQAIIKSAPRVKFTFEAADNEKLGPSAGNCGWIGCANHYWFIGGYVDISPDDPFLQAFIEMNSERRDLLTPGGAFNNNLKNAYIKAKNYYASVSFTDDFFKMPIPVVSKVNATIRSHNGWYKEQVLGIDDQSIEVPFEYTDNFGRQKYNLYEVPVLVHGQKLYVQGNWDTTTLDVPAVERNEADYKKHYVCSTGGSLGAKKAGKNRIHVWYKDKELPQKSVEKYKDGTCSAVYMIP